MGVKTVAGLNFPHYRPGFSTHCGFLHLPPVSSTKLQANNLHLTPNVLTQRSLCVHYSVLSEDIKGALMRRRRIGYNILINKPIDYKKAHSSESNENPQDHL